MKTFTQAELVELASALFGAQNAICYLRCYAPESMEVAVESEQNKIRKAVKILGGVDFLLEIGA